MAQKSKDFSKFVLKVWSSRVIKIPRWIEISMCSNKITGFLISYRSQCYIRESKQRANGLGQRLGALTAAGAPEELGYLPVGCHRPNVGSKP